MKYLPWILAAAGIGFSIYQTTRFNKAIKALAIVGANAQGDSGYYNEPSNYVAANNSPVGSGWDYAKYGNPPGPSL
jgi:hypothetical protein